MWNAEVLDEDATRIIGECLYAAVEGPFFSDSEFQTLFGVERDTVREIAKTWPSQTVPLEDFKSAVIGSLNNLTGYPHREEHAWAKYISVTPERVLEVLDKLSPLKAS